MDRGSRYGIVNGDRLAVTIDRRYHDAVIFDLDRLVDDTAPDPVRTFDSSVPLLPDIRNEAPTA